MFLALVASILHHIALVVMSKFWDQIGLPLLITESIVNGLLGGISLVLTISLAYTADCTDPAQRSVAFSRVHAALYLGLGVGYVS